MTEIERALDEFRRRIDASDRRARSDIARAYHRAWRKVRDRLARLERYYREAKERGETIGGAWYYEAGRYRDLERLIAEELGRLGSTARSVTYREIDTLVDEALRYSEQMLDLALTNAPIAIPRATLNTEAIKAMLAYSQHGSPLERLLRSISEQGARGALDALTDGITLGYNPRKVARSIRDALDITLTRALTIARTESIRALRQAQMASYEANSDVVKQWRWQASLDGRTCLACLAMHGSLHPITESMQSHVNCRCVSVPETASWEELGRLVGQDWSDLDAKQREAQRGAPNQARRLDGEAWFRTLGEDKQRAIMGPARYAAWQDGAFKFGEMATSTHSHTWGGGVRISSLNELLGSDGAIYTKLGNLDLASIDPSDYLDPRDVNPLNKITDNEKYLYLVEQLEREGWSGSPILVVDTGNGGYDAITGSHRIYAAREADINIPSVVLTPGADNAELWSELFDAFDDEQRVEAIRRLYQAGDVDIDAYKLIRAEIYKNELSRTWETPVLPSVVTEPQQPVTQPRPSVCLRRPVSQGLIAYQDMLARMTEKYGGALWSEMTDREMDELLRLESKAYR